MRGARMLSNRRGQRRGVRKHSESESTSEQATGVRSKMAVDEPCDHRSGDDAQKDREQSETKEDPNKFQCTRPPKGRGPAYNIPRIRLFKQAMIGLGERSPTMQCGLPEPTGTSDSGASDSEKTARLHDWDCESKQKPKLGNSKVSKIKGKNNGKSQHGKNMQMPKTKAEHCDSESKVKNSKQTIKTDMTDRTDCEKSQKCRGKQKKEKTLAKTTGGEKTFKDVKRPESRKQCKAKMMEKENKENAPDSTERDLCFENTIESTLSTNANDKNLDNCKPLPPSPTDSLVVKASCCSSGSILQESLYDTRVAVHPKVKRQRMVEEDKTANPRGAANSSVREIHEPLKQGPVEQDTTINSPHDRSAMELDPKVSEEDCKTKAWMHNSRRTVTQNASLADSDKHCVVVQSEGCSGGKEKTTAAKKSWKGKRGDFQSSSRNTVKADLRYHKQQQKKSVKEEIDTSLLDISGQSSGLEQLQASYIGDDSFSQDDSLMDDSIMDSCAGWDLRDGSYALPSEEVGSRSQCQQKGLEQSRTVVLTSESADKCTKHGGNTSVKLQEINDCTERVVLPPKADTSKWNENDTISSSVCNKSNHCRIVIPPKNTTFCLSQEDTSKNYCQLNKKVASCKGEKVSDSEASNKEDSQKWQQEKTISGETSVSKSKFCLQGESESDNKAPLGTRGVPVSDDSGSVWKRAVGRGRASHGRKVHSSSASQRRFSETVLAGKPSGAVCRQAVLKDFDEVMPVKKPDTPSYRIPSTKQEESIASSEQDWTSELIHASEPYTKETQGFSLTGTNNLDPCSSTKQDAIEDAMTDKPKKGTGSFSIHNGSELTRTWKEPKQDTHSFSHCRESLPAGALDETKEDTGKLSLPKESPPARTWDEPAVQTTKLSPNSWASDCSPTWSLTPMVSAPVNLLLNAKSSSKETGMEGTSSDSKCPEDHNRHGFDLSNIANNPPPPPPRESTVTSYSVGEQADPYSASQARMPRPQLHIQGNYHFMCRGPPPFGPNQSCIRGQREIGCPPRPGYGNSYQQPSQGMQGYPRHPGHRSQEQTPREAVSHLGNFNVQMPPSASPTTALHSSVCAIRGHASQNVNMYHSRERCPPGNSYTQISVPGSSTPPPDGRPRVSEAVARYRPPAPPNAPKCVTVSVQDINESSGSDWETYKGSQNHLAQDSGVENPFFCPEVPVARQNARRRLSDPVVNAKQASKAALMGTGSILQFARKSGSESDSEKKTWPNVTGTGSQPQSATRTRKIVDWFDGSEIEIPESSSESSGTDERPSKFASPTATSSPFYIQKYSRGWSIGDTLNSPGSDNNQSSCLTSPVSTRNIHGRPSRFSPQIISQVANPLGRVNWDWKTRFFQKIASCQFPYVDTHCHLDFLFGREPFKGSFANYMKKHSDTFPVNFGGCVAVFCDPRTFRAEGGLWKDLIEESNVWGAVGCHPKNATEFSDRAREDMRQMLQHPKMIALGEIGLDYSGTFGQHAEVQKRVFRMQLQMALELNKPLVIHCRDAESDCTAILEEVIPRNHKVHRHCFTEGWAQAQVWLNKFPRSYIGLTPLVTFKNPRAAGAREVAKEIPLGRLLLETDAPYFVPWRVPRDEMRLSHPGMAITVAEEVARAQGLKLDVVLEQCRQNTSFMYGI